MKIAPAYSGTTIHVLDASRAVGVVADLLDPKGHARLDRTNRADQKRLRALHDGQRAKRLLSYRDAVANRPQLDYDDLPRPAFLGRREVEISIEELVPLIDWTFFFAAWELKGKFPAILDDPVKGAAARDLHRAAVALLERVRRERLLEPRGVYGFWPAAAEGDDVVIRDGLGEGAELTRFHFLRQQTEQPDGRPNSSLADLVAPLSAAPTADHVGAFAVSIQGAEELAASFERDHDDYQAIMVKALADRLAEAFAERLHERARADWGYEETGVLSADELLTERYRGIRPAFGYPACPITPRRARSSSFSAPRESGSS